MANATIEDALLDITQQLTRLRVPYALVGGLAVSIRVVNEWVPQAPAISVP
jgi:hypothetical protein